jgi:hypothetical protein
LTTDAEPPETIDEEAELLRTGEKLLMLVREGDAEERLGAILDRHLSAPIAPDTIDYLKQSLADYTEDEYAAAIILTAASYEGDLSDVIHDLYPDDPQAAATVKPMFRRLRSTYRARLQAATSAWGEDPFDWRNISSDVTFSFSREEAVIRLALELNNGDVVSLNSSSNGTAKLAGYLIERFADLPPEFLVLESDSQLQLTSAALWVIGQLSEGTPVTPDDLEVIAIARAGLDALEAAARSAEPLDLQ